MNRKPRFLFVVYECGNFSVGKKIAEYGQRTNSFDCILWSPYCLDEDGSFREQAFDAGSVYVEETKRDGGLADIASPLSGWLSGAPARLPVSLIVPRRNILHGWKKKAAEIVFEKLDETEKTSVLRAVDSIERRIRFCEDWLVRLGIDVVILPEYSIERDSYGWVGAAQRRSIFSVIVSYGALSAQEAVTAYRSSPRHSLPENYKALVKRHLGRWMAEGDGFCITRLPFIEAIAMELAGFSPFNPWLVNTGPVNAIVLESESMRDQYKAMGFSDETLEVLGHPLQDNVGVARRARTERRAAVLERHGLDGAQDLVLVAMPPNHLGSRPCAFRDYKELIKAFAQMPKDVATANVIVSPHPNTTPEQRAMMLECGVALEEVTAADLIPLCDLYIASVSSTIKWALGAGVPTINFDCYGYNYPDYVGVPQVLNVSSVDEFREALGNWANSEVRGHMKEHAVMDADYWGRLDGHALQRFVQFCLNRI